MDCHVCVVVCLGWGVCGAGCLVGDGLITFDEPLLLLWVFVPGVVGVGVGCCVVGVVCFLRTAQWTRASL